eukprot:c19000_g1_i1.p1 GENE.c19000_g1_i1~~c19000_g1_i1.p1  ORF type:complete len:557 (-),score=107.67 c19000_g1_i1:1265-2914(-)
MASALTRAVQTVDYIVVGSGAAGCVLANRLSKNPSNRVALLEAGGNDLYGWIHVPVGYLYTMNNPRTDWCYRIKPQEGLNMRSIAYPRGKVLGGCTSINGMIYQRGQAADYDRWSEHAAGWSWEEVLPYFKRSLNYAFDHADSNEYSSTGEWHVQPPRIKWNILDQVQNAAEELGIPKVKHFNTSQQPCSGYFQVNQNRGLRVSTYRAFVHPIKNSRSNLKIVTNARAEKVLLKDKRAIGVEYTASNGQRTQIFATKEVLLCAGAIGSPVLLQNSGIGASESLQRVGIQPVHHLPGVGQNLQDHLQIRLSYRVSNTTTLNQQAGSLFGRAMLALQYALTQSGPMSMAPSQLGIFAKSSPAVATPDLQYHIQPLSLEAFGQPLHPFPGITASVCHLRPSSRGFVATTSPSTATPPEIDPNYLSTEADCAVAVAAIKLTRRMILETKSLQPYAPIEHAPGSRAQSDDEILSAARTVSTTIFHPVGTCRMEDHPAGEKSLAVVDSKLKVHGVQGLRVVDASVMPFITSGNTCSPTIMIAEKAADMILESGRA